MSAARHCRLTLVAATAVALGASVGGCKPAPPPDLLRTQRADLEKAKAVEGILQQRADQQRRDIDDASR